MNSLTFHAVRNAAATALYVFAVAWFMQNAERLFGTQPGLVGSAAIILLFVVSALVTGGLVLWKPAQLLIEGKKRNAGRLLFLTGAFLAGILILAFVVLALI